MSKKYKGKTCTYCGRDGRSISPDHVIAREFFLVEQRPGLPLVPACRDCNDAKARLEHYLTAVLPFGGRHQRARDTLTGMVPRRLDRNQRLRRELNAGRSRFWAPDDSGLVVSMMALPLEPEKLLALFRMIVKGLLWHHWQVRLRPVQDEVTALVLASGGEAEFDRLLALPGAAKVDVNLGEGAFRYQGSQGTDLPQISVWRLSMYGGIRFGDPDAPGEVGTRIGVLTGPKRV